MSVLAERCSADGPDGLHGVGGQGLVEVVVGGVGRVGAARGPGLDVYAHPGHITVGPSLTAGGALPLGAGRGRLWDKKLIFGWTGRSPLGAKGL